MSQTITTYFCLSALLTFSFGCAITPPLSPIERRAMQSRTFEEANYDSVFRAFKNVLQDEGYIIKNQDMKGGLIVATIEKTDSLSGFNSISTGRNQNYRMSEGYEISVNLEELGTKSVESRMTIQKLEQFSQGGKQGREILDQIMYKSFYDKVRVEVERRKAQGKA